MYNEIRGGNEKVVANTFRLGLLEDFELRELLMMRPPEDIRQLMRRIEEYKMLEDDWQLSKGKALVTLQYLKESRQEGFQVRPRRDLRIQ